MRILTTTAYPDRPEWVRQADAVRSRSAPLLIRELVARAGDYDAIVLQASKRPQQVAAAALAKLRPRTPVFLQSATWKRGVTAFDRLASRNAVRLLNGPSTHFCVLTRFEREQFSRTWGVDPNRVHLTPWYYGLTETQLRAPVSEAGYVFSGGDSMRDYRPLLAAAPSLAAPVRVAALRPPPIDRARLAPNVEFGPMAESEYFDAMCAASVVVVALAGGTERSAGQNNYLNPMALGKLVIVSDGTGVRDYLKHRETAIVVPPDDPEVLAREIRWSLDPANATEVRRIAERGRAEALERFSPDRYAQRLLDVVAATVSAR